MRSLWNRIALTLFISFSISSAAAGATASKLQKISEILELYRINQVHQIGQEECISAARSAPYAPETYAKKNGKYYGFSPTDAAWPYVVDAYKRYTESTCNYFKLQELRDLYINYYNENLSENELDDMLRFLKSPSGEAFRRVQDDLVRAVSTTYMSRSLVATEQAQKQFESEIHELAQQKCTCTLPSMSFKH